MKKILVVQIRTGEYEKHEQSCFESVCPDYFDRMEFVNGLIDYESLPQTIEELNKYSCIIIGGSGEADVSQVNSQPIFKSAIKPLEDFISLIVHCDFPMFAICLGHQLLCHTLGSDVKKENGEIGSISIEITDQGKDELLLEDLEQKIIVQTAHKDCVLSLPQNAELLATNQSCRIQMIKLKQNMYGVQFHAEMTKKEYLERHELYAKLNPETGYSKELPRIRNETQDSNDGPNILNAFLARYSS